MGAFAEGYAFFEKNIGVYSSAELGGAYVGDVENEVAKLAETLNAKFSHNNAGVDQLKGNIAEFWHAGTFNIDAVVKGSSNRASVLESNEYGSVDVLLDSGVEVGSKYYKTALDTLKQQAKNARESYHAYLSNGGKLSFEEYMRERGITDPNAAVYSGQVRLVPKEQLEEIKKLLTRKIATEKSIRPEQVQRYEDTLKMINDKIQDENVSSVPLDTDDAKELARLAKENGITEEKLAEMELSTENLIGFKEVMNQAFNAGLTAATITLVLKAAPEIYKAISYLIKNGELDAKQLKKVGFAALTGASEGFVRGTVSAALTTACKVGLCGSALKSVNPSVIGAVTAITMNTMKNSYEVVAGTMTQKELANELVQEMFVSTCSLALGTVGQAFIEIPVLGFMLGSFVGSIVGSFAYNIGYNAMLSFCVDTGFTMFGLVEQDYKLPPEVFDKIGVDVFEYEKFDYEKFNHKKFTFDKFSFDKFEVESLSIRPLRRGVIGVSQVGYIS